MQVTKVVMPSSKYSIKCPYSMTPSGITIHNTANDASAMSEISYMINNNNKVSFHEAIDDYRVVQGIDHNRNAWHSGDGHGFGNMKTIGIEICYSKSGVDRFNKAEQNAAERIAYLMNQYGWNLNNITDERHTIGTHQNRSGKYCPHRTLDNGLERFYNMIREEYKKITGQAVTGTPIVSNPSNINQSGYTVKITASVLNVRSGPGINYGINTTVKKNEVYTIAEENNGWGKLKSGAGWISLSYTTKNSNNVKSTNNTNNNGFSLGLYVVNTSSGLNVRSGPGTNYGIKKAYTTGTRFDTYEINGDWARTPSGWVNLKYCKLVHKY